MRETLEEAGVAVRITGVLRFMLEQPRGGGLGCHACGRSSWRSPLEPTQWSQGAYLTLSPPAPCGRL